VEFNLAEAGKKLFYFIRLPSFKKALALITFIGHIQFEERESFTQGGLGSLNGYWETLWALPLNNGRVNSFLLAKLNH